MSFSTHWSSNSPAPVYFANIFVSFGLNGIAKAGRPRTCATGEQTLSFVIVRNHERECYCHSLDTSFRCCCNAVNEENIPSCAISSVKYSEYSNVQSNCFEDEQIAMSTTLYHYNRTDSTINKPCKR